MRIVVVLIGVVLAAAVGWQIGLLMSVGALSIPGMGPVVGVGSTLLLAGGGALIGGLLGAALCLLVLRFVSPRSNARC